LRLDADQLRKLGVTAQLGINWLRPKRSISRSSVPVCLSEGWFRNSSGVGSP
jgi:hypothetical protein